MTRCIAELPDGPLDLIGDVHGHWDALRDLLGRLGYDAQGRHPQGRRLVFVGDLIDRGPDSPAVLDWVFQRVREGRAWAVMGNHELNLLRGEEKEGNDWFWNKGNPQDHKFEPFARLVPQRQQTMLEQLATLPLALVRDDLRVVHACWEGAAVAALKDLDYRGAEEFRALFDRFEQARAQDAAASMAEAARERAPWEPFLKRREVAVPVLPANAQLDVLHQNGNPIRVLTSGLEEVSKVAHFAGGKWRFTDRQRWWNTYAGTTAVVVGHYWRRPLSQIGAETHHAGQPPDLMDDVGPTQWMGPLRNVFCVDYSVAAGGVLAAMRWPEREIT
jgi:hypothetical protein